MPHQKGFLEELQSMDEGAKKRVLIISTIVIMIIVVGIWLVYFNTIVGMNSAGDVSQATTTTPGAIAIAVVPTTTIPAAGGVGLWQNIENGFVSVFRSIANIFSGPSNYKIQPQ
jgi:hypothetical protein